MNQQTMDRNEAWYRNGMVWLIVSIPALTILGCLVTIYLALANPDYLVKDPGDTAITSEEMAEDVYD